MGGMTDILFMLMLLGGGYMLYSSGKLDEIMGKIVEAVPESKAIMPAPASQAGPSAPKVIRRHHPAGSQGQAPTGAPGPAAPGGGGGGGGSTASTGTGDCAKTIYAATGQKVDNSKRTKQGTRHYASGKPDDVTSEWGSKVSFKNYEFTAYFTITKIDHDDTVSFKFGGTHMGSGWFDHGVGFNSGQFCMGAEKKHPSADLCIVKGKSIGSILNKKIGVKCIIVGAGSASVQQEMWGDKAANGQWELMVPRQSNGVGGWAPASANQECTIRIDAAPGITMHCSAIQEISGWNKGAGGTGGAPVTPSPTTEPAAGGTGNKGGQEPEPAKAKSNYSSTSNYSERVHYY